MFTSVNKSNAFYFTDTCFKQNKTVMLVNVSVIQLK